MTQSAEDTSQPFGVANELMPGVFRVRLPLDFQEDHINVWVLYDGEDISIIDTGVGTRETQELWSTVLEEQFADRPLRRVICTHWHPDHMGVRVMVAGAGTRTTLDNQARMANRAKSGRQWR